MNNELKQKLEVIISPRLLLERLPVTPYGVAFVAWGVYNRIGGGYEVDEESLRTSTEEFISEHSFCIKLVEQLISAAQINDTNSFVVFASELRQHPECIRIVDQMFPVL